METRHSSLQGRCTVVAPAIHAGTALPIGGRGDPASAAVRSGRTRALDPGHRPLFANLLPPGCVL